MKSVSFATSLMNTKDGCSTYWHCGTACWPVLCITSDTYAAECKPLQCCLADYTPQDAERGVRDSTAEIPEAETGTPGAISQEKLQVVLSQLIST